MILTVFVIVEGKRFDIVFYAMFLHVEFAGFQSTVISERNKAGKVFDSLNGLDEITAQTQILEFFQLKDRGNIGYTLTFQHKHFKITQVFQTAEICYLPGVKKKVE